MRSAPNISAEAKSFLERLLKPEGGERAALADLISDPWITGSRSLTANQLRDEMVARKLKVDGAKAAEREKARRAAAAKRVTEGGAYDPMSVQHAVRRSAADDDRTRDLALAGQGVYTTIHVPAALGESGRGSTRVARVLEVMRATMVGAGWERVAIAPGMEPHRVAGRMAVASREGGGAVEVSCRLCRDSGEGSEEGGLLFEVKRAGGDMFDFRAAFDGLCEAVEGGGGGEEDDLGTVGEGPVDMI